MNRLALFALLLSTPGFAQDKVLETVTVHGRSLVGVWHGTLGQSGFRGLFGNLWGMTPMELDKLSWSIAASPECKTNWKWPAPSLDPWAA